MWPDFDREELEQALDDYASPVPVRGPVEIAAAPAARSVTPAGSSSQAGSDGVAVPHAC